jgi:DHA1 family tetracycline resistance protein-like MFS transporter
MTRDLRLLSASLFLWGIGEGLFFYLQPIYLAQLGADVVQVGFILGLAGAAMTVTHIPAGALADRLGRKSIMALAWIFGTVASLLMFLSGSLWLFVAALLMYSLTSFVMSPLSSYVTVARGPWSVGRALTSISAAFNAGAVIGPVVGGVLAARSGIRGLFGFAAVLFVVSTVFIFLLRDQPVEPPSVGGRIRTLAANPQARRVFVVMLVAMFALFLAWPLTPLYLNEVRGLPVGQVGALGSLFALGIVVFNLTLGTARARSGSLAGHGLVAASAILLWRGLTLPVVGAGYLLAGGGRTVRSLLSAQLEGVVSPSNLGLAFGVGETVASSGLILAPLVAGALYRWSPAAPYPVSLGLIAVSFVFAAWVLPRPKSVRAPAAVLEVEG